MTDDDKLPPAEQGDPEALLYDFSKFQTTLAILVLGGVLTLSQTPGAEKLERQSIMMIIGLLALGGTAAFSSADLIVRHRLKGLPRSPWLRVSQVVALGGIGLGIGAFLGGWAGLIG